MPMNVVPALTQGIKRRRWVTLGVLGVFLQVACSHTMVVTPRGSSHVKNVGEGISLRC